MRSKIKIRFFIIFLGIFAIALISSTFMAPYNHNQELSIDEGDSEQVLTTPPKLSKSWNNFTYIHILDNWTIAAGYEWCSGDGSWSYPYVLENITINAASSPTGNGIWIQNSENDYFIIRNCSIMNSPHGGSSGGAIFIDNSNNGTLIGNNLTQNYLDIHFYRAENMTVIGNHITGEGSGTGINMYHSSNNFFLNNIVENKHYYSMLIQGLSNNNVIKGNTFIENTGTGYGSGISISQSNENNISYNILSNNNNGIKIDYTADKNIIHSNIITQNDYYGAVILNSTTNCTDNVLYNNTFNNPNSGAVNAFDNGSNTQWYLGTLSNRWHDYIGKDANDDGIGDTPYYILRTGHGIDKFPIFDDGSESDDDDDDKKTKKSSTIPGYHLDLIIIICFIITGICIIQNRKRLNL